MSDDRTGGGRPVALVTGAARGIGRSTVLALARAGYDVAINYASSKSAAEQVGAEAEAEGARALLCQADVADEAAVTAMVERDQGDVRPSRRAGQQRRHDDPQTSG